MNNLNFIVEGFSALFVLCIHLILFIDDTVRRIHVYRRNNNTCNFTDHMKFIDQRIKEQSEKQTFESLYVKHVELKLKMIERDRCIVQKMIELEEKIKVLINVSEKNTYVALEPFLNDINHTTFFIHEPIDYIQINLSNEVRLTNFDDSFGSKGKNCFFEFFLYDINDNLIDEFDIDFGTGFHSLRQLHCDVDRSNILTKEITSYLNEKLNLSIKDEKNGIYSNKKGNSVFFASPCIKITLHSKICFKKIIISTKDTVIGLSRNPHTGNEAIKPKDFRVELSSWNDDKIRKNIVKQFSVDVKNSNYTCVIYNYVPFKITGNIIS